ncbi:MAG: aspartate carbamoyltransferase, partial [Candidatus Altarchaeaceae archaeon]
QRKYDVNITERENLGKKYDVIYVTRIQKERFADPEEYEYVKDAYKITKEDLSEDTIVMHPLPRLNEIDREIDKTKNAVYFIQAKNGIYVRMAIIDYLLEEWEKIKQ